MVEDGVEGEVWSCVHSRDVLHAERVVTPVGVHRCKGPFQKETEQEYHVVCVSSTSNIRNNILVYLRRKSSRTSSSNLVRNYPGTTSLLATGLLSSDRFRPTKYRTVKTQTYFKKERDCFYTEGPPVREPGTRLESKMFFIWVKVYCQEVSHFRQQYEWNQKRTKKKKKALYL